MIERSITLPTAAAVFHVGQNIKLANTSNEHLRSYEQIAIKVQLAGGENIAEVLEIHEPPLWS